MIVGGVDPSLCLPLSFSLCAAQDDEVGDELVTKADKKKKEKAAAADAKDQAKETKKLLDAERAEAARLAKQDAEDEVPQEEE